VRWRIVALLLAYSFMSWFNRNSMGVAGNGQIIDQLEISETKMGWVYTVFFITYALCMTPGGWFSDRYGAWIALVIMGFGSALFGTLTGAVGLALASGGMIWLALLTVRSLMGILTAPIYPASGRLVVHWLPFHQRGWGNGLITGAALVGIASTYYGFGVLMDAVGWPVAFLVTGAVTSLLALIWFLYAKDYPAYHGGVNKAEQAWIDGVIPKTSCLAPDRDSHTDRPNPGAVGAELITEAGSQWISLLANRSLMLLTISYAAIGYVEYLFYFWLERYFEKGLELPKNQTRLYTTIVMLGMSAGMMTGGWLSDRFVRGYGYRLGRAMVPVAGMILGAILVLVGLLVTETALVVVCFTLALAAVGACEGPCWATAIDLGGRHAATSAGIFNTGGNVGGQLAPVVTPWVAVTLGFGWFWGISLGSIVCMVGVVLWLWIDPRERHAT
jgi:sugar phosphate permease